MVIVGRIAVVPIRQGPTRRPAKLDDRRGDDLFKAGQVSSVPGQEVPGLMLALIPKIPLIGARWERHICRVGIDRPQIAMDRCLITPACRVGHRPVLQIGDRFAVPVQVISGIAQLQYILACANDGRCIATHRSLQTRLSILNSGWIRDSIAIPQIDGSSAIGRNAATIRSPRTASTTVPPLEPHHPSPAGDGVQVAAEARPRIVQAVSPGRPDYRRGG